MRVHNFIPPIRIHPILIVFILISFLTGTFVELFIILSIVFIHEFGHYAMARFFNWKIRHIMLWVFGGVMETDEHGSRPIHEEVLVTIAGPIQHLFIYLLCAFFSMFSIFPESIIDLILFYNTVILVFNLIPIWPLDGGKLLFLAYSLFMPFRKAYHIIVLQSLVTTLLFIIIQFSFFSFNLSIFLVMLFLFMENRQGWKQRYFVFMRFLLQRYHGNVQVKKVQPIVVSPHSSLMDVFIQFKRDKKHSIYVTDPNSRRITVDENECLQSYFHDKSYDKSIGEVLQFIS